jgi:transcriptional regulator with XRE-family HTH domain
MAPSKDAPGRHRPSSRLRNLFVAAGVAAGVPVGIPAATVLGALAGTRRARYLRARRTELGLTQAQAAKAAGVSLRTWQNLESARHKVVAEATLTTAIAALGIPDTVEVPVTTDPDDDALEAALPATGDHDVRAGRLARRLRDLTPAQLDIIEAMLDQMSPRRKG